MVTAALVNVCFLLVVLQCHAIYMTHKSEKYWE